MNKVPDNPNIEEEGISLESILSEYKGKAFMSGEKKLSKDKLEEEIKHIVLSMKNDVGEAEIVSDETPEPEPDDIIPDEPEPPSFTYREEDMTELEKEFFGVGKYARSNAAEEFKEEVENLIKEQEEKEERRTKSRREIKRIMTARAATEERERQRILPEEEPLEEESEEEELGPSEASRIYGATLNLLLIRGIFATVFCIVLGYLTFAQEFGFPIPSVFAQNITIYSAVLMLLLMVVMLLGLDIFIVGIKDIMRLRSGAETLVAVSCIVSIADSVWIIAVGDGGRGLPYCAVSAFSMMFAIWGLRFLRSGLRISLRTASVASEPYVVSSEADIVEDGAVVIKSLGNTQGFTRKTERADLCESTYLLASPMLLIASFVLAGLASVGRGRAGDFLHSFSALTAVIASFSSLFVFSFPFHIVAKKLMRAGAALAGWTGASDIGDSMGMVIRDEDIFPIGTLSLNGIRIFSGASMQKVVTYTASIIIASGSGLAGIFKDLLKSQACSLLKVDDYSCYEAGGVGAVIRGERVLIGSSGFMNLMGIRLPPELTVKNAIFAAINDELVGIFAINYTPVSSVQNALVSILRTKIEPLFAIRDFNISPLMLSQKFRISMDKVDFMTIEDRYKLSQERREKTSAPVAILCREGLGPFAEAVASAKRLISVVKSSTVISIGGALIGMLLMFYLCWSGTFEAASAANTLTYMLLWLIPVVIIGNSAGMY